MSRARILRPQVVQPVMEQVKRLLSKRGVHLTYAAKSDMEPDFWALHERAEAQTMTSVERMYALYQAIQYIERERVPGAVLECGVWRGGSTMLAALTLLRSGSPERELWLYDTFAGMTEPAQRDVHVGTGIKARTQWEAGNQGDRNAWCYSALEEVRSNMRQTGYPDQLVRYVEGKVEDTIPDSAPDEIALLRLDTDWYESTRHELEHLFPRLVPGGVLIVDDYGFWAGARQAVDEYFAQNEVTILLNRIDYTGRIGVRPK